LLASATLLSTQAHAAKVYQVATDAAYAPFESVNEKKEIVGFDMDVIKAVASKAGIEVKLHTKLLESNVTQLNIRSPDAEKMK
jgi:polar amino acid transport system substrate-binding protein